MGITFIEDLIPEFVIIALAFITLILCLYSAYRNRDLPAAGYIIPLVYIIGVFTYFRFGNPDLLAREFFSRIAYIMLLLDISIWRIVEIIANKRRNGTGFKPITLHEFKQSIAHLFGKKG